MDRITWLTFGDTQYGFHPDDVREARRVSYMDRAKLTPSQRERDVLCLLMEVGVDYQKRLAPTR